MIARRMLALAATSAALALVACQGKDGQQGAAGESAAATSAGGAATATPAANGKVIEVKMMTDDQGNNRFEPNDFEAHEGDILRFTLVSGVHNAHFLPDSNAGKQNLPAATELLQLPGQTKDVPLTFGTGRFYFQCDPHALLGMIGHVKVEAREHE
ncbi:MAG TPA: plastocyanin/azurin family copper-binding protein [Gemmatimonadaceae bacterium]|nr:plastocyanin/azurin family copper-binding protein [Gemmatimonadaceae bacterium]